jgi:uncharacterized protein with PQ loop repeat
MIDSKEFWEKEIFGYLSMIFYSTTMIPQIYKCYQTKDAEALSYLMLFMSMLGTVFNLIYALILWAVPIIVSACLYLAMSMFLVGMKYRYRTVTD